MAVIVVLGLVFGGFATVYGTVLQQGAQPQLGSQALAVADACLSEITSRPYRDPDSGALCGGGEASRPLFDDVCDYNGLVANACTATSGPCPALGDCACGRDGHGPVRRDQQPECGGRGAGERLQRGRREQPRRGRGRNHGRVQLAYGDPGFVQRSRRARFADR